MNDKPAVIEMTALSLEPLRPKCGAILCTNLSAPYASGQQRKIGKEKKHTHKRPTDEEHFDIRRPPPSQRQ